MKSLFLLILLFIPTSILFSQACSPPQVKAYALSASCTNDVPNNDAYLQISEIIGGDKYGYSIGSNYTGPNYTSATDTTIFPIIIQNNIANPVSPTVYSIRVFNGSDTCYLDTLITLQVQDCIADCNCTNYLFLNDASFSYVEKFEVNSGTGELTQIPNLNGDFPWINGPETGLLSPHGIGSDINGFLYIADVNDQQVARLRCDGSIVQLDYINLGGYTFNFFTFENRLYAPVNGAVKVYDLCTGNQLACSNQAAGWGYTLGTDGYIYTTTGFNGNNNGIYRASTDLSGYSTDLNNCTWNATLVIDENDINIAPPNPWEFVRPMGIVQGNAGNIYVVVNNTNFGGCSKILKFDTNYDLVAETDWDCDDNDGGWAGAVGITYSPSSNLLYAGSIDDCVAVFDTALNFIPALSLPWPAGQSIGLPKAIGQQTECCPTPNRQSVDLTVCVTNTDELVFLNEILDCNGTICEGMWEINGALEGMTYNECDQSVQIQELGGCTAFIKGSDGTGSSNCGAFELNINVELILVPEITIMGNDTLCLGEAANDLTATTTATDIEWQQSTISCNADDFTPILGATSVTYNPGVLSETTYFRAVTIGTGDCTTGMCEFPSECITVYVDNSCCTNPSVYNDTLYECTSNNMASFDLNSIDVTQDATSTISYHPSLADANAGNNALNSPYSASNGATVFVRVEKESDCYSVSEVILYTLENPMTNDLTLEGCNLGDSTTYFNLVMATMTIDSTGIFTVSYHNLETEADMNANPINITNSYNSNEDKLFIRIESDEGCYTLNMLTLEVIDCCPPLNCMGIQIINNSQE